VGPLSEMERVDIGGMCLAEDSVATTDKMFASGDSVVKPRPSAVTLCLNRGTLSSIVSGVLLQ